MKLLQKIGFCLKTGKRWSDKLTLLTFTIHLYAISHFPKFSKSYLQSSSPARFSLLFNGKTFQLYMRLQDFGVFYDVFMNEIYRVPQTSKLADQNKKVVIWDLGAHIGLASCYYYSHFSDKGIQVLAIEPYLPNFQLLQMNIGDFANYTSLNAAVENDTGTGYLNTGQLAMNNRLGEKGAESQCVDIFGFEDLLQSFPTSVIDIMKIDIEGSEFKFLENIEFWSVKPSCIIIEFHDKIKSEEMKQRIKNLGIHLIEA